jgi:hypothetical protein
MPYLIVEYAFDPPIADENYMAAFGALKPCLEVRGIRRLRSYLATDRTWGICEYEAADAESLREAYRTAKVPFAKLRTVQISEFGPLKL